MKKILKSLLLALLIIPNLAFGAIAVGFNATSTDFGFITPNLVNGNKPFLFFPYASTTATSTMAGINLPYGGCFAIAGTCITSGGGSSVGYPFPLTGNATSTLTRFNGGLFASSTSLFDTIGVNTTPLFATLEVKGTTTSATGRSLTVWDSAGTNLMTVQNDGKVGIGTSNPRAKLTSVGSYSIGSSIPTTWAGIFSGRTGIVSSNDSFYFDIFTSSYTGAEFSTYNYNSGTPFPMIFQANGGNIGIGTTATNPQSLLSVNGGIAVGSSYYGTAAPSNGAIIQGNVGIGTSSPGSLLSIGASATGINFFDNATSTFSKGINMAAGCYAIAGTCISGGSGSSSVGPVNTLQASNGSGGFIATGTPQLTVGNILATTTAQNSFGGNISIASTTPFGQLSVNTSAGSPGFVVGSSTKTQFIVDKIGQVGIGTASPVYPLHIVTNDVNIIKPLFVDSLGGDARIVLQKPTVFRASYMEFDTASLSTQYLFGLAEDAVIAGGNTFGINYWTGSALVSRFTVDPNGRVGVNDITADYQFETSGSSSNGFFGVTRTTDGDLLNVSSNGITGIGTTTPSIVAQTNISSSTASQLGLFSGAGVAGWTMRNAGGNLYIGTTTVAGTATTSTPALTLTGSGKPGILIGSTTGATSLATLDVFATNATDFPNLLVVATTSTTSLRLDNNGQLFLGNYANCTGTNALEVSSGQVICGSTISDARLKKDFNPITDGLSLVEKLNPTTFFFNDNTGNAIQHNATSKLMQYGFKAQDIEDIMPSAVGTTQDGYLTLDKTSLIAPMVSAIQQLNTKINNIQIGKVQRSAEENWQWIVISILALGMVYQQRQIKKLSNEK